MRRFPKDKNREKWLQFCESQDEWILPLHRLCAKHFLPSDIENGVKPKLKKNAVPTITVDSDDDLDDDLKTTRTSSTRKRCLRLIWLNKIINF